MSWSDEVIKKKHPLWGDKNLMHCVGCDRHPLMKTKSYTSRFICPYCKHENRPTGPSHNALWRLQID